MTHQRNQSFLRYWRSSADSTVWRDQAIDHLRAVQLEQGSKALLHWLLHYLEHLHPYEPSRSGQLAPIDPLLVKQGVSGSNPLGSTRFSLSGNPQVEQKLEQSC